MLMLTSDGLSTDNLRDKFKEYLTPQMQRAAIITTAANPFAERHPDIDRHIEIMENCGLTPTCIDIESQNPALLLDYDVIIIIGGNPYYLLNVIQQKDCQPLFKELLAKEKIIVGMSAGSMVLGTTIDFVNVLTPEMNVGMEDYSCLSLTDLIICPHASSFVASIAHSEETLAKYEQDHNRKITRIDDGQAIFI